MNFPGSSEEHSSSASVKLLRVNMKLGVSSYCIYRVDDKRGDVHTEDVRVQSYTFDVHNGRNTNNFSFIVYSVCVIHTWFICRINFSFVKMNAIMEMINLFDS